jgi:hypothetical protein
MGVTVQPAGTPRPARVMRKVVGWSNHARVKGVDPPRARNADADGSSAGDGWRTTGGGGRSGRGVDRRTGDGGGRRRRLPHPAGGQPEGRA